MRVLFVSPHSDDVCLSIAGLVSHVAVHKHLVTAFSASCWADPSWTGPKDASSITSVRTSEDMSYCSNLRMHYHCLGLPDSSIRHRGRGDLRIPSGEEHLLQQAVIEGLQSILDREEFDLLVGPLGVGGHADHLVCTRAVRSVARGRGIPAMFYEDLPYAAETALWRVRLDALRVDWRLAPVLCQTDVPTTDKQQTANLYETQSNDTILHSIAEHSSRLSARFANQLDTPNGEVVERVWVSGPPSSLFGLFDSRVSVIA